MGVSCKLLKFRLLVITSNFDVQGGKSKLDNRGLIWVVSQVIQTHGLAARALFMQGIRLFSLFCGDFWKICGLVTTSHLGFEGLIWSGLISAPHRHPGQVSSLKNKLSRAILVAAILQSEGFWAHWESAAHFWTLAYWWPSPIFIIRVANES